MLNRQLHIPWVLSEGLKLYTGGLYPAFVPVLGWAGTFLTGYGVASLMLFGQLQIQAAGLLGISPAWLSAGLAVGASIGSISSPFKIAIAAPMCGAVGKEGDILRWTIPIPIGIAPLPSLLGLFCWLWCDEGGAISRFHAPTLSRPHASLRRFSSSRISRRKSFSTLDLGSMSRNSMYWGIL